MAAGPVLALLLLLPAGGGGVPGGPGSDAPSKAPPPDITAPWDSAYEELCAAPPLTGPCRAAFHRWFYSPQHRQCRPFIYGGCRGNRNNYRDREECLQRCGGVRRGDMGGEAWGHWGQPHMSPPVEGHPTCPHPQSIQTVTYQRPSRHVVDTPPPPRAKSKHTT
eukprot:XP_025000234.1 pancreatic trypsin inhibitor-like [Gallus gallus]